LPRVVQAGPASDASVVGGTVSEDARQTDGRAPDFDYAHDC